MSIAHPVDSTYHGTDCTVTWRDLADRGTPEQIADHEAWEVSSTHPNRDEAMLILAQRQAQENAWQRQYADVAAPADARDVGDWEETDAGAPERHFWSTYRDAGATGVVIHGFQQPDGRVTARHISIDCDLGDIDAGAARAVGSALLAAADELERLSDAGDAVRT